MSSIIAMLAVVVFAFFIARRNKDHKAFLNLMIPACFGFIVGVTFKSHVIDNHHDDINVVNQTVVDDTMMCPTLHCFSPAVVGTVENEDSVMGKEKTHLRDSVTSETEEIPAKLQTTEILDDS